MNPAIRNQVKLQPFGNATAQQQAVGKMAGREILTWLDL
jgi:hypothetical protein